jgi:hypothetical protein
MKGWIAFGSGNSEAFALSPKNNWFALCAIFLIFISIPFLLKEKKVYLLYCISILAFYAIFKYAFARQENQHSKTFLDFIIFISFFILIIVKNIKPYIIALLFIMIMLYDRNLEINRTYHLEDKIQLSGINNFTETVLNYSSYKAKYLKISESNLQENILPKSMLEKIGSSEVDFFPWDLIYAAANNLNYKPRTTLQSACLYMPPIWMKKIQNR